MKTKGFTLIELMITIAVMAILASVVGAKFGKQVAKAKNAKGIQIISTWKTANVMYYSDKGVYANVSEGFGDSFSLPTVGLALYVDKGTLAKTSLGASNNISTITVGYASTGGTDKDTVTLTYTLENNLGEIKISGGDMKAVGATLDENWDIK